MEKEHAAVQKELKLARDFSPVATLEEQVKEVEAALFRLHEALDSADWFLGREWLRQIVSKIVVYFEHTTKRRTWSRLVRAEVYRRQDERIDILSGPALRDSGLLLE